VAARGEEARGAEVGVIGLGTMGGQIAGHLLAAGYRVTGRDVVMVHVIGGGTHSRLHCQLIANILGRPVIAGPSEASALGNVLVQARAAGELGSLTEMRAIASRMDGLAAYDPGGDPAGDELYGRFLDVTGLGVDPVAPAVA